MAQLQRNQQRRARRRRGIPLAVILVVGAVIGIVLTSTSGGSKKVTTGGSTTVAGSSTTAGATTTVPFGTGLVAHAAPAVSASCNTPAGGAAGTGAKPASGHAVSIVPAPAHVPFPSLTGSSPRYTKFQSAPPFCIDVAKTYTATVTTDIGPFTIKFLPKNAPLTVNNFIFLAGYHYYDGVTFHRVIPGFMDQGGDPTATGGGSPGYSFKDELPSSTAAYDTGAVAMANSGPNTNGSQIFIVVPGGGAELSQAAYSVFGQVTSGISVVEKINSDGTSAGTPKTYHHITKITIAES